MEQKKASKTKLYLAASSIILFLSRSMAAGAVPEFSILTSSGTHTYSIYTQVSDTQYTVDDAYVSAMVTDLGGGFWSLNITQAKQAVSSVTFPWQSQRTPLDSDISDDIFYFPHLLGYTRKASDINTDFSWWGLKYPGGAALPLVVMADADNARIVAATNWPSKSVTPQFAAQRMILRYDQPIPVDGSATYGALIATVTGNASAGNVPWQLALDLYKSWLASAMGPVTYPAWIWDGQGILNIQLENLNEYRYSTTYINNLWQPVKSLYPWILMWGQMSRFAGGCCNTVYNMDSRYLTAPSLPDYVKNTVVAGGYHAGYYSAPYWHDPTAYSLNNQRGRDWLTGWINHNRTSYNANSFYIDTLAGQYWGEPDLIKGLMDSNTIPLETMIEGTVDVFPRPSLTGGSLTGDYGGVGTAPFMRPENFNITSFPNFVRYALGDRLIYEGPSNTDYKFWGAGQGWKTNDTFGYTAYCAANGPCEYGTERLVFLLGAKLDYIRVANGDPIVEDPIVDAINAERIRVNWWSRKPIYLDTKGLDLTSIPASSKVEISHFQDINGVDLLAVSNPNLISGLTFTLNGKRFAVPVQKITVIDN